MHKRIMVDLENLFIIEAELSDIVSFNSDINSFVSKRLITNA